jgi:hypothetical protein
VRAPCLPPSPLCGGGAGGGGGKAPSPPPPPLPRGEKGGQAVAALLLALLALGAAPKGRLTSGPQAVTAKIGAFNPLNVTGDNAGKKHSLVAAYGARPVILVLARSASDELTGLVKSAEAAAVKHDKANLAAFVVVCGGDDKTKARLEELARGLELKKTVLTLLPDKAGPKGYDFHPEAEIQVVLYVKRNAKAQLAYKKGELKGKDVEAALAKVLPAGKK